MTAPPPTRAEAALERLLHQLVPARYPDESEANAETRWQQANDLARPLLNNLRQQDSTEDVGAAADLIKKSLLKGSYGQASGKRELERVTRFSNLYSRLLAQPILVHKWAILWFLWKAGDVEMQGNENENISRYGQYNDASARQSMNGTPRIEHMRSKSQPTGRETASPRPFAAPAAGRDAHSESVNPDRPSDSTLLRDLPFTLQGLSSKQLQFDDNTSLKLPSSLPTSMVSLFHILAEPGLLYRSLSTYTEATDSSSLISQSLRSAISIELRSYLSLVSQLEGQVRKTLQETRTGTTKSAVTLKRMVISTRDATAALRLISLIVESAQGKKGGEIISMVHDFASGHGDPFVHVFAERLLGDITQPFYDMLRAWIYGGELEDPYKEFFVLENDENVETGKATSVWENKYSFQEPLVPSIMTVDFARRIFLIGKSLNFLRYSCDDNAWVEEYTRSSSHDLNYGDDADLFSSIDTAYTTVMARLLSLMDSKFSLFAHLAAMKKYLFLGQGDFIALLLDSLATTLDRPANSQYRHILTGALEHAIRNSNAQFDQSDAAGRLDARMLDVSQGEMGWDVFTLDYRIDSPLDVIVTTWASKQYLKIFNFLWRVKRVEYALDITWRRCMTGARGVLSAVSDKLSQDWKLARGGLAEMVHFVSQLQWYILFEVIEAGWEGLQRAIQKPDATLDSLIEAHTNYLNSITHKGLLGQDGVDFTSQLHELLKLMLAYREAVDSLYSISVAEFTKRQERAAKIETRTTAGRWGADEEEESFLQSDVDVPPLLPVGSENGALDDRAILEQLRARLQSLRGDFKARINMLLGDLRDQPDTDMRFLAIVMNFNNVYAPVKRRKPVTREKPKAKEAQAAA